MCACRWGFKNISSQTMIKVERCHLCDGIFVGEYVMPGREIKKKGATAEI